ncbi:MarR family transcriptional regulator [Streptomyces sp. NPDC048330]|uniref:MarR family winged helix-turn-helix transcriptional regulator n=1 Tax=Streptomyces sp. NPDC048330 TaxID=3365533 RepID=UPI0037157920
MEQPVVSGTAHDASGNRFTLVGISNVPTDWADVFRALAGTDLSLAPAADTAPPERTSPPAPAPAPGHPPKPVRTTPPSVLDLNAYLMSAVGKAARRRLTDALAARGLRLWHLTVLTLLDDLGPQMKTALATRLDINVSDLVKIVNDLVGLGDVVCVRDTGDRRRVVVRLTPHGRASLAGLTAEIAATDDDVLAPLDEDERRQLASLLRRVHHHLTSPSP